ncbi:GntR family transcriptional regulator [soil metagenome]
MMDHVEERIYRSVFESVMSHRLTPGTKLPESSFCELFGASRTTVRRVLQRLAHDHIVQLRPNRGAIVAVPSPEETQLVFEARRGIEAAIVRLVTARAGRAELDDLRDRLRQEHEAMHRFDQPAWSQLASSFHTRLGELSGNPILQRFLSETVSRCSLVVALYEPPGNAACEHAEHQQIVDRIAAGDAEGAIEVMDAHLRALEGNLKRDGSGGGPDLARMLGLR